MMKELDGSEKIFWQFVQNAHLYRIQMIHWVRTITLWCINLSFLFKRFLIYSNNVWFLDSECMISTVSNCTQDNRRSKRTANCRESSPTTTESSSRPSTRPSEDDKLLSGYVFTTCIKVKVQRKLNNHRRGIILSQTRAWPDIWIYASWTLIHNRRGQFRFKNTLIYMQYCTFKYKIN